MSAELRNQKIADAQAHLDRITRQSQLDWRTELDNFLDKQAKGLLATTALVGLYVYFRKKPTSLGEAVKHFHAEVLDRAGKPYLDNPFAWGSSVSAFWSFCETLSRTHDQNAKGKGA